MMVDLILLERVEKLGQMGQLVKVKPGFARNYLLPQKKALRATKENLAYFEIQRAQLEANNLKRKGEAGEVGARPAKAASFMARCPRATFPTRSPPPGSPSIASRLCSIGP